MKNISFFKKIKLFLFYRKSIKSIEKDLQYQFNIRIDKSYRLYTVFNVPSDIIEEPYNLRVADYDQIIQAYIKDYTKSLSVLLNSNGLNELYDFYKIDKIDSNNYLIVYGFSLFQSHKFIYNLYKIGGIASLLLIIYFLFKTFM